MTTLISPIASAKTSDLVFISQTNELVTDSFHIAKYFGKRHDDVLKKIRNVGCSRDFAARNFAVCHKNNELQNNKIQPFYQMTKDGFMFLVMGFTGKRAAEIKERYINAFNEMADKLSGKTEQLPSPQYLPSRMQLLLTIEDGKVIESKPIAPNEGIIAWDDPKAISSMLKLALPNYAIVRKDAILNALNIH
ncbi:Rha family transcriptional regulator [Vibrio galatheae]|uniref:Rha family transcriptional regulator n=1 Tax=Vibrio galatheae TaxID=579748 RepID=UPI00069667C3|nr:Rha family transcriptional regulator [Vibrio galatheae]